MAKGRCLLAVAVFALSVGTSAQDARAVLQAASTAMGAANLKTIQYTGTGWNAGIGQSYSANDDWPKFEITTYARTIDYDARSSHEDLTRRHRSYPPRGGAGTPLQGDQRPVPAGSRNPAWEGPRTTAGPPAGRRET